MFKGMQSAASLTLKQTKSENGSVTATMPHEIMVRSQPQIPMPLSDSSAEKEEERKGPVSFQSIMVARRCIAVNSQSDATLPYKDDARAVALRDLLLFFCV